MELLPLLGRQLKDGAIIDILEGMDMDVLYDFDRLNEGQPDRYWAASKEAGIQLGFDAAQALEVIFLYIMPSDGFAAFSPEEADVPLFTTIAEAQAFGETRRLQVAKGKSDFLGVSRSWVRIGFPIYSTHYEFQEDRLALVTITRSGH